MTTIDAPACNGQDIDSIAARVRDEFMRLPDYSPRYVYLTLPANGNPAKLHIIDEDEEEPANAQPLVNQLIRSSMTREKIYSLVRDALRRSPILMID